MDKVKHFIKLVSRFHAWGEGKVHDLREARAFLIELIKRMPEFDDYWDVEWSNEEYDRRGYDGWKEDYKRFGDLPFQYYQTMFDPLDVKNNQPCLGDLRDDFADIYGDLHEGLDACRKGNQDEAISMWLTSYYSHWEWHATNALKAINAYFRNLRSR